MFEDGEETHEFSIRKGTLDPEREREEAISEPTKVTLSALLLRGITLTVVLF